MSLPLVSIIIPAYNAEKLLRKCLQSLESQTYKKIEIIFIDDCSNDSTYALLNDFKDKLALSQPVKIVHVFQNVSNMGVANSRNVGLSNATGEYLYYLDADDYLSNDSIEILVNTAQVSNADIVGGNWMLQFKDNGRLMRQPKPINPDQAIEFMAKGIMKWNLWLFLVKRELYTKHQIRFLPNQNMGEDMMVMFKLLIHAKSISMVDNVIYHYSQANTESITKIYSNRHKQEVTNNLNEVIDYYIINNVKPARLELFNYLKLSIKLPLLISKSFDSYREWLKWFPESNSYCMQNDLISFRIKLLQFVASKGFFVFVRIHYTIVVNFIYGVIYK